MTTFSGNLESNFFLNKDNYYVDNWFEYYQLLIMSRVISSLFRLNTGHNCEP